MATNFILDMFKKDVQKLKKVRYGDFVSSQQYNTMFSLIRMLNSLYPCDEANSYANKLPFFVSQFDIIQPEHHNYMVDAIKAFRDCVKNVKDTTELDEIISKMRYVQKSDSIISDDKNTIIDALSWIAANAPFVKIVQATYCNAGYATMCNAFKMSDVSSYPLANWWTVGSTLAGTFPNTIGIICTAEYLNLEGYPYEYGNTPSALISNAKNELSEQYDVSSLPTDIQFDFPIQLPAYFSARIPYVDKVCLPVTVSIKQGLYPDVAFEYYSGLITIRGIIPLAETITLTKVNDFLGQSPLNYELTQLEKSIPEITANIPADCDAQAMSIAESHDTNLVAVGVIRREIVNPNGNGTLGCAKIYFDVYVFNLKSKTYNVYTVASYDDYNYYMSLAGINVLIDLNKNIYVYYYGIRVPWNETIDKFDSVGGILVIRSDGTIKTVYDGIIPDTTLCFALTPDYKRCIAYGVDINDKYYRFLIFDADNVNVFFHCSIVEESLNAEVDLIIIASEYAGIYEYTMSASEFNSYVTTSGVESPYQTCVGLGVYYDFQVCRIYTYEYNNKQYVVLDTIFYFYEANAYEATSVYPHFAQVIYEITDEGTIKGDSIRILMFTGLTIDQIESRIQDNIKTNAPPFYFLESSFTLDAWFEFSSMVNPSSFVVVMIEPGTNDVVELKFSLGSNPFVLKRVVLPANEYFASSGGTLPTIASQYPLFVSDPAVYNTCGSPSPFTSDLQGYWLNYGVPRILVDDNGNVIESMTPIYVDCHCWPNPPYPPVGIGFQGTTYADYPNTYGTYLIINGVWYSLIRTKLLYMGLPV